MIILAGSLVKMIVFNSAGTQEAMAKARDETGDKYNIVVIRAANNYDCSGLQEIKVTKVSFTFYQINEACVSKESINPDVRYNISVTKS